MSTTPQAGCFSFVDSTLMRLWQPGTSDWSFECWFHGRYPTEYSAGLMNYWPIIMWDNTWDVPDRGIGLLQAPTGWFISSDFGTGQSGTDFIPPDMYRWFYLYGEWDRSGNASLYVNGQLVAQVDISGDAATNVMGLFQWGPSGYIGAAYFPLWMGPMAHHSRLLSRAEQANSWNQGSVHAGAQTLYAIDPRQAIVFEKSYAVSDTDDAEMDQYVGNTASGGASTESYKSSVYNTRRHWKNSPAAATGWWYYSYLFKNMAPGRDDIACSVGSAVLTGASPRWSEVGATRKIP